MEPDIIEDGVTIEARRVIKYRVKVPHGPGARKECLAMLRRLLKEEKEGESCDLRDIIYDGDMMEDEVTSFKVVK